MPSSSMNPRRLLRSRLRRLRRWRWAARDAAAQAAVAAEPYLKPVFVGGTGRSGTTITGRLLGSHPAYRLVPGETRFITAHGGLCDLARGRSSYQTFADLIVGFWYRRTANRGLHRYLDLVTIEAALPELRDGLAADPWAACRRFTHRLLDPLAEAHGAIGWVEMSPTNAKRAPALLRMFPDMRLVHTFRDGRDAACSVAASEWGPDDVDHGLQWWARKLELAYGAGDGLPVDRVIVVQMEDLVLRDREHQYQRLLDFLGLQDDPAMRTFFDGTMTPDRAHIGRWRDDVPADRLAAFALDHQALAERLISKGVPYRPMADVIADSSPAEVNETVAV